LIAKRPIPFLIDCTILSLFPQNYKEKILDAAETVLGFFGFDRTAYSGLKKNTRRKMV
jgi:hypothetical protein